MTHLESRKYELMYIIRPDEDPERISSLVSRFRELIGELGGAVENLDEWGDRRLAYEIDDYVDGYYVVVEYRGDETLNQELERRIRLDEAIMRSMITRVEE